MGIQTYPHKGYAETQGRLGWPPDRDMTSQHSDGSSGRTQERHPTQPRERNQGELPGGEAAGAEAPLWNPHHVPWFGSQRKRCIFEAAWKGCVWAGGWWGEAAIEGRSIGRDRGGDPARGVGESGAWCRGALCVWEQLGQEPSTGAGRTSEGRQQE